MKKTELSRLEEGARELRCIATLLTEGQASDEMIAVGFDAFILARRLETEIKKRFAPARVTPIFLSNRMRPSMDRSTLQNDWKDE